MSLRGWWNRYRPKEHGLVVMTLQAAVLGVVLAREYTLAWASALWLLLAGPVLREIQRQFILRGDRPQDGLFALAGVGLAAGGLAVTRPDAFPLLWAFLFLLFLDGWFQARAATRNLVAETSGVLGLGLFLAFLLHLGGWTWEGAFRVAAGFALIAEMGVFFVRDLQQRRQGRRGRWPLVGYALFGSGVALGLYPLPSAFFLLLLLWGKVGLSLAVKPPETRRAFRRLGWAETAYTTLFIVGWVVLQGG